MLRRILTGRNDNIVPNALTMFTCLLADVYFMLEETNTDTHTVGSAGFPTNDQTRGLYQDSDLYKMIWKKFLLSCLTLTPVKSSCTKTPATSHKCLGISWETSTQ